MKVIKKPLRIVFKAYTLAAAALVAALVGLLIYGAATGRVTADTLREVKRVALGPSGAAAAPGPRPGAAREPAAPAAAGSSPEAAPVVYREIERAAEDLRMWEDRMDLLGRDLGNKLLDVGKKDLSIQEQERAWASVKKAMVPLLNQLLAGTPGWRPITEAEFVAVITGGSEAAGGARGPTGAEAAAGPAPPSVAELLERLRSREAAFVEAQKTLRGLAPEVLAGILAAGLRGAPAGGGSPALRRDGGSSGGLSDREAARLLVSLEPARMARVFKALRDEDPAQAALLLSLVLRSGEGGGSAPVEGSGTQAAGGEKRG